MVLLEPGVWPDTAVPDRTWMADLWPAYGEGAAVGDSFRYYYGQQRLEQPQRDETFLRLMKAFLEAI